MAFAIVFMIIGCGIFGYCLNQIGIIVNDMNKESIEFNQTMRVINNYFAKKKIDNELQY